MSQREFDRAVIAMRVRFVWGLEGLLARASVLQSYNAYVGTPDYITADLDRYRTSSPEKVRAVAETYLAREHRVEAITVPTAAPATPPAAAPDSKGGK